MLVGYNTNISYKDRVYHIQTEDCGQNNPVILTLLYSQGAILASKKASYAHIIDDSEFKDKVTKMMKALHKGMIRDLLAGKYTGDYKGEEERETEVSEAEEKTGQVEKADASGEPAKQSGEKPKAKDQMTESLDDILLKYIMKRSK